MPWRSRGTGGRPRPGSPFRRSACCGWFLNRDRLILVARLPGVAEQIPGLAAQGVAEPGQGAEADGPGSPVLQDRQVDDGDPDLLRQGGQRHAALSEEVIQPDLDRGWLLGAADGCPHAVALSSSSMEAPSLMIRAKVISAAPARRGTGSSAYRAEPKADPGDSAARVSMELISIPKAGCWITAAATAPAMTIQPSSRIVAATRSVKGPSRCAVRMMRHSSSRMHPYRRTVGTLVSVSRSRCPIVGCPVHARRLNVVSRVEPGFAWYGSTPGSGELLMPMYGSVAQMGVAPRPNPPMEPDPVSEVTTPSTRMAASPRPMISITRASGLVSRSLSVLIC